MAIIVSDVHDALVEAGASEAKAKVTAEAHPAIEQLAPKENNAASRQVNKFAVRYDRQADE